MPVHRCLTRVPVFKFHMLTVGMRIMIRLPVTVCWDGNAKL
jgi:hypothetical protein